MGKKIIISICGILVFVVLDIFARFLFLHSWFSSTTLSKEVNPFDIISLIVTTIATIWLAIYVSKKLTELRYQKEYLINDVKLIEQEILYFDKKVMGMNNLDLQGSVSDLNKMQNYIHRFCQSLKIFELSIDTVALNKTFKDLFFKITDTNGTDLVLDDINKNEIGNLCNELILVTRTIVSKINKH